MNKASVVVACLLTFVCGVLLGHQTGGAAAESGGAPEEAAAEAEAEPQAPSPEGTAGAPDTAAPAGEQGGGPGPGDPGAEQAAQMRKRPMPDRNELYDVPAPPKAPSRGAPKGSEKLLVQAFVDFQCPACARAGGLAEDIAEHQGDEVRVVFRNYPLDMHQNAMPAAEAAWEVFRQAGNDKFWEYHDVLFDNQRQLTRDNFEKWAEELGGIDMDEFRKALDTHRNRDRIKKDIADLDQAGFRVGTPTFVIGKRVVRGVMPYNGFKNIIRKAKNE